MGHRDTLLCDSTYRNATSARSATRERVRRTAASFKWDYVYISPKVLEALTAYPPNAISVAYTGCLGVAMSGLWNLSCLGGQPQGAGLHEPTH